MPEITNHYFFHLYILHPPIFYLIGIHDILTLKNSQMG